MSVLDKVLSVLSAAGPRGLFPAEYLFPAVGSPTEARPGATCHRSEMMDF